MLSKFVELDLIASNYSRILVICNQKFAYKIIFKKDRLDNFWTKFGDFGHFVFAI